MGVGTSLVIFAAGAILKFATNVHSTSFNIQTIGIILMCVGAVGFVVSLFYWGSWGGIGGYHRRTVYRDQGSDPRYGGGPGAPGGRYIEDERGRY